MKVTLTSEHVLGMEEAWDLRYVCPNCHFDKIYVGFNFCGHCGVELEYGPDLHEDDRNHNFAFSDEPLVRVQRGSEVTWE